MKTYQLFIDGGTTNTKFVLVRADKVMERLEVQVGASDAESNIHNKKLEVAVRETLEKLEEKYGEKITDIYASGMITSNVGLYEVKHIVAPICAKNLKEGMVSVKLAHISEAAMFHFVPGIRFLNNEQIGMDICRGEETEVFGILKESKDSVIVLHFGSHNKMLYVEDGFLCNSITTIGGELLWAISQDTIVKSAVGDMKNLFVLNIEYVKKGYYEALKGGLSRAMFQARIQRIMYAASEEEIKSYLYGAILFTDIQAFMTLPCEKANKIILYGRNSFLQAFYMCKEYMPKKMRNLPIEEIAFEESRKLSLIGIKTILEAK